MLMHNGEFSIKCAYNIDNMIITKALSRLKKTTCAKPNPLYLNPNPTHTLKLETSPNPTRLNPNPTSTHRFIKNRNKQLFNVYFALNNNGIKSMNTSLTEPFKQRRALFMNRMSFTEAPLSEDLLAKIT